MSDKKKETTAQVIKDIIDLYGSERQTFFMFLTDKKLSGEFIKWAHEKEAEKQK